HLIVSESRLLLRKQGDARVRGLPDWGHRVEVLPAHKMPRYYEIIFVARRLGSDKHLRSAGIHSPPDGEKPRFRDGRAGRFRHRVSLHVPPTRAAAVEAGGPLGEGVVPGSWRSDTL